MSEWQSKKLGDFIKVKHARWPVVYHQKKSPPLAGISAAMRIMKTADCQGGDKGQQANQ